MLLKCSTCGLRISRTWLLLALPWSKYSCSRCGSVFAGTVLRFLHNTIGVGVLGILVIRVVKGKAAPHFLLPMIVLLLVLFLGDWPGQIKPVGKAAESDDAVCQDKSC